MRPLWPSLALFLLVGCASTNDSRPTQNPTSGGGPVEAAAPVAVASSAPTTATGRVIDARFFSDALGVEKPYRVYLPAGYESDARRYPVIYMLHGLGGSETNWSKHLGLSETADKLGLRAIVVMPDGDDGFYSNWVTKPNYEACLTSQRPFGKEADMKDYCVKNPQYEDYLVDDLIGHVDSTYRTVPERASRGIGGLSMGGFGALYLSFRHKDLFSVVASHAGVASLLYRGPHPYDAANVEVVQDPRLYVEKAGRFGKLFEAIFGLEIQTWKDHDPVCLAADLKDGDLAIYLDAGTRDEFRLHDGATHLHDVLDRSGIDHVFELIEGGQHDGAFWRDRIDDSLMFFAKHLRQQP